MPPSEDRAVVLHALELGIDRCAKIIKSMEGGAPTFESIARTARQDEPPMLAAKLQAAAQRGAHIAHLAAMPHQLVNLAGEALTFHDDQSQLTSTAFVIGLLHQLSPEQLLTAMQHAVEAGGQNSRLCSGVGFPPEIRPVAMQLARNMDSSIQLQCAASVASSDRFPLSDAETGFFSEMTRNWGPHIRNVIWSCPDPRYGATMTVPPIRDFNDMIEQAAGLHDNTVFALLGSDAQDPLRLMFAPQEAALTLEQHRVGLRRAQLHYAMYSGGTGPQQLLITDWHELAELVTTGSSPMIDHVLRLNTVGPGASIGELSSTKGITDIAVLPGKAFPDGGDSTRFMRQRFKPSKAHKPQWWSRVTDALPGATGNRPGRRRRP